METFVYNALPGRIVFGEGALEFLPREADSLGIERVLVLSTPEQVKQAEEVVVRLGGRSAGIFPRAKMHTPVSITDEALARAHDLRVDGLVAIGGGSTTGLSKAIALRTDLPQIVIPTTYAGSEMTPILGETKDGSKVTQRTPKVLPEVVIYDVSLTMNLPPQLTFVSGINAMAHAVEALYAQDRNPVVSGLAIEGVRALFAALPAIARNRSDRNARYQALYGAWLCGMCLGSVGMALHHKLCHVLGGSFDLPHAETHTVVLPHALAYNASAAPEAMQRLSSVLGPDPAGAIYELAGQLGVARALKDIGMRAGCASRAADAALSAPYWNPRPLEREAILHLIERAYEGAPPLAL
jgi:maleylacetate reductase